jgi:hypothetical protein
MKLSLFQYNIPTQGYSHIEYTTTSARVFAITVNQMMNKFQKSVSVYTDIQSECWTQEVWRERMGCCTWRNEATPQQESFQTH